MWLLYYWIHANTLIHTCTTQRKRKTFQQPEKKERRQENFFLSMKTIDKVFRARFFHCWLCMCAWACALCTQYCPKTVGCVRCFRHNLEIQMANRKRRPCERGKGTTTTKWKRKRNGKCVKQTSPLLHHWNQINCTWKAFTTINIRPNYRTKQNKTNKNWTSTKRTKEWRTAGYEGKRYSV